MVPYTWHRIEGTSLAYYDPPCDAEPTRTTYTAMDMNGIERTVVKVAWPDAEVHQWLKPGESAEHLAGYLDPPCDTEH